MLVLRRVNSSAEEEWKFLKNAPIEENGMTNPFHGVSRMEYMETIIPLLKKKSKGEGLANFEVPETFLFLWKGDTIVGLFKIRHRLTDELRKGVGHISFYIASEFRQNGYATEGLRLALDFARTMVEEDEFLLSANNDNKISLKVMLNNGGKIVKKDERKVFISFRNSGRPRIHLETVAPNNWQSRYKLSDKQKKYVSDPMGIMARAWAYRKQNSEVYVIYADYNNIGMVLCYEIEELKAYGYSQFFIDYRYQQRGFGAEATQLVLDKLKENGKYDSVYLCYIKGNEDARRLYESLGFVHTQECDKDEIVMKKKLR
ncbi:MAG: GNAT family N-acetyltransferase [Lachnospiraceae bacterium]|nr:GNAT family N-acetyltransferase [Lachnospiraceae bacterium]